MDDFVVVVENHIRHELLFKVEHFIYLSRGDLHISIKLDHHKVVCLGRSITE